VRVCTGYARKLTNIRGAQKEILRPPWRPQDGVFIIVQFPESWSTAAADGQELPNEFQSQLQLPHVGVGTGGRAKSQWCAGCLDI